MIIHLGVHKTATTHFQSRLYNSIPTLAQAGVGYLGLDKTRELITSKIFGNFKIEDSLEKLLNEEKRLLISDENIIGGTDKLRSELIYPDATSRLNFLFNKIPVDICDVHITIRNPEDYLISRYCEYLRHYKFMSISEYFDSFDLKIFSWMPLISAIENVTGKNVQVTLFENVFDDEDAYLQKLTGVDINFAQASEGASIRRSKISLESYRILEHLADHYPRHMTKRLMNMMDNNPQRSKTTLLKPFSKEITAKLKENYARDKLELGL